MLVAAAAAAEADLRNALLPEKGLRRRARAEIARSSDPARVRRQRCLDV